MQRGDADRASRRFAAAWRALAAGWERMRIPATRVLTAAAAIMLIACGAALAGTLGASTPGAGSAQANTPAQAHTNRDAVYYQKEEEAKKHAEEEAAKRHAEEEAATKKRGEEAVATAAKKKAEEEAATKKRQEEEAAAASIRSAQIHALLAALAPSGRAGKIAALLKNGGFAVTFMALEPGRAVIDWHQVRPGAKLTKTNAKPILVAAGQMTFSTARTAKIKLKLTAKGTFTPPGKTPISVTRTFVLKR